jgi:hypothetical protein
LTTDPEGADAFLIDSLPLYLQDQERIDRLVAAGKTAVLLGLPAGEHQVAGGPVQVSLPSWASIISPPRPRATPW